MTETIISEIRKNAKYKADELKQAKDNLGVAFRTWEVYKEIHDKIEQELKDMADFLQEHNPDARKHGWHKDLGLTK